MSFCGGGGGFVNTRPHFEKTSSSSELAREEWSGGAGMALMAAMTRQATLNLSNAPSFSSSSRGCLVRSAPPPPSSASQSYAIPEVNSLKTSIRQVLLIGKFCFHRQVSKFSPRFLLPACAGHLAHFCKSEIFEYIGNFRSRGQTFGTKKLTSVVWRRQRFSIRAALHI